MLIQTQYRADRDEPHGCCDHISYGIIERENYNKPKSENSKQPGCPSESPISEADLNATNDMPPTKGRGRYIYEEKVKAIEDAMRHFQMI